MKRSVNIFLSPKFMFHIKPLERLLTHPITKFLPTKPEPKIELKNFINFDLDCLGWYATGHYSSQDFLMSLSQKGVNIKPRPETYYLAPVQRIWAKIDDVIGIEQTEENSEGAVPITFIELFYE
jgi:hypothetical protein